MTGRAGTPRLLVVEGVRRPLVGVERRALAGLLELLLEDLALVLVLMDRAGELFVEPALLRLDAAHEIVEVLRRRLLLVGPDDRSRLGVDLEQGLAAGTDDVERLGHEGIVLPEERKRTGRYRRGGSGASGAAGPQDLKL